MHIENNNLNFTSINGGVGIKLVHDRLVCYFGPEFGIKIEGAHYKNTRSRQITDIHQKTDT